MRTSADGRQSHAVLLVRNGVSHDARVLRAAHALEELGHRVTIVGSVTTDAPLARERVEGVDVIRVRARSPVGLLARAVGDLPDPLNRLHRTLTSLDWHRRALFAVGARRPALVHANDLNTMWTALALRVVMGSAVVYDSHELWPDRNGRREWRRWLVAAERVAVKFSTAVVTASPGYADELHRRYRPRRYPRVIRNIPAATAVVSAVPRRENEAVYVGGLMRGRGLEAVIGVLTEVPELRLRLIGAGREAYVQHLRALADTLGVGARVTFAGAVPPSDVVDAAAGAAFGLCLIEPVCRSYELTLPNKLFEYAAAGIPVLAGRTPVVARTVVDGGFGEIADPADRDELVRAIRALLHHGDREAARRFGHVHTWAAEREKLVAVYRDVVP